MNQTSWRRNNNMNAFFCPFATSLPLRKLNEGAYAHGQIEKDRQTEKRKHKHPTVRPAGLSGRVL